VLTERQKVSLYRAFTLTGTLYFSKPTVVQASALPSGEACPKKKVEMLMSLCKWRERNLWFAPGDQEVEG
jgi:hypothetical protein